MQNKGVYAFLPEFPSNCTLFSTAEEVQTSVIGKDKVQIVLAKVQSECSQSAAKVHPSFRVERCRGTRQALGHMQNVASQKCKV